MFFGELLKLFQKRMIQVLFFLVLAGNALLLYVNEYVNLSAMEPAADAYAMLQEELGKLEETEKQAYLEQELAVVNALDRIETETLLGSHNEQIWEGAKVSYEEALNIYAEGIYPKYTSALFTDRALLNEVLEEMEACCGYTEYVQEILDKALSSLQKLEDQDSYQFHNLAGMYYAFENVKQVQNSYGPSKGVKLVLETLSTDLWALLFLLMCCVMCISVEREKNLLILAKSTRNGRGMLGICKLMSLWSCCLLAMCLYLENVFIAAQIYGLGDLSRSIQSVSGYQGCTLRVSVGTFLLLVFFGKLLYYVMCVTVMYLLCACFRKTVWVYAAAIVMAGFFGLLYTGISNTSYLIILKLLSPLGLMRTEEVLGAYKNMKLGDLAINRMTASFALMAGVILISGVLSVVIFACMKERETKKTGVGVLKISGLPERMESHTGLLRHECYKVLISQHVLPALILSGAFMWLTFEPVRTDSTASENYYKSYMERVTGPEELIADTYWEELEQNYEELYAQAAVEEDRSLAYGIEDGLKVLQRVKTHAAYLKEHPGSWYLYDGAYRILTGDSDSMDRKELYAVLFLAAVCAFCYVGMYAADYQNDGIRLLKSTAYGRGKLTRVKFLIGVCIGLVVYALAWLPQLVFVIRAYGLSELAAPANSLEHLYWYKGWISIRMYLILLYAVRFAGVIILMLFAFAITTRFKSFIVSAFVLLGLTALPTGLAVLGVGYMRYVLLAPMLSGNDLLLNPLLLAVGAAQGCAILTYSVYQLSRG